MADFRHAGWPRGDGRRWLSTRLRREARVERPQFSAAIHGRVLAALAAGPRRPQEPRTLRPARFAALLGGVAAAAACVAVAVGFVALGPPTRPGSGDADRVATESPPGIERLPTPGEIGAGVLAEMTSLAAAAVGVPEWTDLAGFDPAALAAAEEPGR